MQQMFVKTTSVFIQLMPTKTCSKILLQLLQLLLLLLPMAATTTTVSIYLYFDKIWVKTSSQCMADDIDLNKQLTGRHDSRHAT